MKEFDKYIKDNLYNYESPVPEGLWDRIVADKDKKKPTPIPFWKNGYFQSAIIAVIAFAILGAANWYTNRNTNTSASTTQKETPLVKTTSLDNTASISTKNTNVTATIPATLTKQEENKTVASLGFSAATTKKSYDKKNVGSPIDQSIAKFSKTLVHTGNIPTELAPSSKTESNAIAINSTVAEKHIGNNNSETSNTDNSQINQVNEIDNHYFERGSILTKTTSLLTNKLVSKTLTDSKKTITAIHLPNTSAKNWFVELYASPDYDIKKVNTSGANSLYTQALDTAQKLSGGFTVGVRISKNLNNHFSLKSGIQFKEITERFRYKQFESKSLTVVTERSYVNNDGATISNKDTTTYVQTGYRLMTSFNIYKQIEIPVIASYQIGSNKWHFSANGGIIANIASFYEGKTFDNSLNIAPLSTTQQNGVLKSTVNLSAYAGVSFLYDIGKNFDAFAEPYCKYGLSNSSNASFSFGQRFNSIGLNLGIRYKIPHTSIK